MAQSPKHPASEHYFLASARHQAAAHHYLVETPFVATNGRAATNAIGEFPTELLGPQRIVSWLTMIPRVASISSTIRRLSGNRKYSYTA